MVHQGNCQQWVPTTRNQETKDWTNTLRDTTEQKFYIWIHNSPLLSSPNHGAPSGEKQKQIQNLIIHVHVVCCGTKKCILKDHNIYIYIYLYIQCLPINRFIFIVRYKSSQINIKLNYGKFKIYPLHVKTTSMSRSRLPEVQWDYNEFLLLTMY